MSSAATPTTPDRDRERGGTALVILDMLNRFDFAGGESLKTRAEAAATSVRRLRDAMDGIGAPTIYVKTADSGARRAQAFCGRCGSPLYTYDADRPDDYGLRVGCIDQRAQLAPQRQIWCRSALAWALDIRGLAARDGE